MKLIKGAALVLAVLLFSKVVMSAVDEKNYIVAAPLSLIFLVLAYLGEGMKVKSFSFDADDHKLSVNEGAANEPKV